MKRIIKATILGALGLFVAGVLFLAASILVDTLAGKGRIQAVTNTSIPGQDGGPAVRAYVARPAGAGPFPAVIMIHEFYGVNESIVGKAEGLAQEGYIVMAPDTFRGSTTAWIPRAIFQVVTARQERVNQDLDAVYAWLETQPEVDPRRIAILGFCYGGRTALTYSLHNPKIAATAIFYGAPETDPQALKALPGPVLGIYGGADTSIPVKNVRAFDAALSQAGIPHEVTIYEEQPHAFVRDIESIRAGGVQGQAWAQLLDFLRENLKGGSAAQPSGQPGSYREPFAWGYYLRLAFEHAVGTAHPEHSSGY